MLCAWHVRKRVPGRAGGQQSTEHWTRGGQRDRENQLSLTLPFSGLASLAGRVSSVSSVDNGPRPPSDALLYVPHLPTYCLGTTSTPSWPSLPPLQNDLHRQP